MPHFGLRSSRDHPRPGPSRIPRATNSGQPVVQNAFHDVPQRQTQYPTPSRPFPNHNARLLRTPQRRRQAVQETRVYGRLPGSRIPQPSGHNQYGQRNAARRPPRGLFTGRRSTYQQQSPALRHSQLSPPAAARQRTLGPPNSLPPSARLPDTPVRPRPRRRLLLESTLQDLRRFLHRHEDIPSAAGSPSTPTPTILVTPAAPSFNHQLREIERSQAQNLQSESPTLLHSEIYPDEVFWRLCPGCQRLVAMHPEHEGAGMRNKCTGCDTELNMHVPVAAVELTGSGNTLSERRQREWFDGVFGGLEAEEQERRQEMLQKKFEEERIWWNDLVARMRSSRMQGADTEIEEVDEDDEGDESEEDVRSMMDKFQRLVGELREAQEKVEAFHRELSSG